VGENPAVAIDFEAEGLLKGTRGKAREARRELLRELESDGVSLEELRRAVEEDRLALLPVERALEGEGARHNAAELAELSGLSVDFLTRYRQALGLPVPAPDEPAFTDEDVEAASRLSAALDAGLPEQGLLEQARVLGMATAQVSAANRALVGEAMLEPGLTELEAAHRYADAARGLAPLLTRTLDHVLRLHLREQIRSEVLGQADLAAGRLPGGREVTACFADMVGFTRLGERVSAEELGPVTGRLTEMAGSVARGPVKLVKMIGDAAMLVSPDNDALLEAALDLVAAAEAEQESDGFPLLRAGVARGQALPRSGDWYGRPINLASRVSAIAYPGSVLVAEEVREAAGGGFNWSFAGAKRLKGIRGEVKLFRCRRDEPEEA
jgi:adenylate cyclase